VSGVGDASEAEVSAYFEQQVRGAVRRPLAASVNPIPSVYINKERKFAFVEFATLELANTWAEFDGLLFRGAPLKLRRPDDYNATALTPAQRDVREPVDLARLPLSQPPTPAAAAGGGGAGGARGAGLSHLAPAEARPRIYIGSIAAALTEAQLRELVSAFGAVHKLDVPRAPDGGMRGYAFVEYIDAAVTDVAISALDGLAVGDKKLSVSRAKTLAGGAGPVAPPPPPPHAMMMMMPPPGAFGALGGGAGLGTAPGSRVAVLDNMVLPDEVATESTYRDILAEIAAECAKYGTLTDVTIPRPPAPAAGRVFLSYADPTGVHVALQNLVGRQFSGRAIRGGVYDEAAFRAGVFTK
jgi:splicing factor U2AF subunit